MNKRILYIVNILFFSFLVATTSFIGQAQTLPTEKVSFKFYNTTLTDAIAHLEQTYGIEFAYFNSEALNQKVNVIVKELSLINAIQALLEETIFSASKVGDKWVLQTKKPQLLLKGSVLDEETQSPLAHATVSIKGQRVGSASNQFGDYVFNTSQMNLDDSLSVSMLGYHSRNYPVQDLIGIQSKNFELTPKSKMLEEVWVTDRKNVYLLKRDKSTKQKTSSSVVYGKFLTKARLDLPIDGLEQLDIKCGAGKMEMVQHNKNVITIEADIITTSIGEKVNKEFVDKFLRLFIEEQDGTAYLKSYFTVLNDKDNFALTKFLSTPGSKINLKVYVPANLAISIDDGAGDIFLKGLNNKIRIEDGSGDLTIDRLIGDLYIRDNSGKIDVRHVVGNVKIIDDAGDLFVSDLNGKLVIKDGSGDIAIEEVVEKSGSEEPGVLVYDRSGKVLLEKMNSNVKMKDRSGKIEVKNVNGDVQIRDRSGSIYTQGHTGKASFKDRSGKIYVDKQQQ